MSKISTALRAAALGPASVCTVCQRCPKKANSWCSECSHVDCPHRRKAWSERPDPSEYFAGPWPKNVDEDPKPADEVIK